MVKCQGTWNTNESRARAHHLALPAVLMPSQRAGALTLCHIRGQRQLPINECTLYIVVYIDNRILNIYIKYKMHIKYFK